MTKLEIEKRIEEIDGTMRIENLPLAEQDKQNIIDVYIGKYTEEEVKTRIINNAIKLGQKYATKRLRAE